MRTAYSAKLAYPLISANCEKLSGGLGPEPLDPPEARKATKDCEPLGWAMRTANSLGSGSGLKGGQYS